MLENNNIGIHEFICKYIVKSIDLILPEFSIVSKELTVPRGRIDILAKKDNILLIIEFKCLYYSGKMNQQANRDKALGQVARYMFDLSSGYFGFGNMAIKGLVIASFLPYKVPDMRKWNDIELWHTGNSDVAYNLRVMIDNRMANISNLIVKDNIPEDLILAQRNRIDKLRELVGI